MHSIEELDTELVELIAGGFDGLGPYLPPAQPDNSIDPFILDQLRRLRMYGTI